MKKAYIAAICVCVVLCCTFGFLIFSEILSPSSVGAHENSSSEKVQSVTISEGEAAVLETDNDYRQSATEWSSDNEEIVTVEGGGRIDALKQGSACVTANLANGDRVKFNITVSAPEKQAEADKFSTAYTANQDILKKNLANKSKKKLPYQIMVNRSQNCVTVYTYDSEGKYTVPVRAMVCSCGKDNSTVLGIYDIQYRCEWQSLVKESFGQYACQFYGDYLFHSVPYSDISKSSLKSDEYNKLGSPGSMGCVRLSAGDCKWVYDNCADRTAVVIYDNDNPGPLGKPEGIKLSDFTIGWDPTDNDAKNPYNNKTPQIVGAKDITIKAGDSFDKADGVTALDTCSNDITEKMEIIGNPNTYVPGKYKVTYSVTDVLNRSVKKEITVTVEK